MSKLERVLDELNRMERVSGSRGPLHALDPRAKLLVTVLFLIFVLSLPLSDLPSLIVLLIYPILSCGMAGIGYGMVFVRSLLVLPFILFIGIFNPIFDQRVVFYIGGVTITAGWISFASILLRGLLSVQAMYILIYTTGFYTLCRGMRRMGMPSLFTTQLLFVYRYISVLLLEAIHMGRARTARGFGRKSYPYRMWGIFIGQLLIRTVERSERVHHAMLARGFTGSIEGYALGKWRKRDTLYLLAWSTVFVILRLSRPASLMDYLVNL